MLYKNPSSHLLRSKSTSLWPAVQTSTHCILQATSHRKQLVAAIQTLYRHFSGITDIHCNITHTPYEHDAYLVEGIAISPLLAAKCLAEPYRTIQFLRGIYAAIQQALQRFPQHPIRILYAGCGPYATLLLPMTTQFTAEQIQITLLDIHERSLTAVQQLFHTLQLDDYIEAVIQTDATTFQPPTSAPYHLLVIEMLQGALHDEMQVATTLHLIPFLHDDGLLIPQETTVEACLTPSRTECFRTLRRHHPDGFPVDHSALFKDRTYLGKVLTLNKTTAYHLRRQRALQPSSLPAVSLTIPASSPDKDQLMLLTTITIFETFTLENYQSEVCHPVILYDLHSFTTQSEIEFSYVFGPRPFFNYYHCIS